MKIFDSPYYIINKRLLKIFGLWPYLSWLRKNISLMIMTIISFSLVIPLVAALITLWSKNKLEMMECAVGALYIVVIYSKYFSAYLFEDRIKLVYEQIADDWKSINDKDEINILHKFSQKGRFLSIVYISYAVISVTIFAFFPFIPLAMDVIFPANKPHMRIYLPRPNYFVIDDLKYYYELFLVHSSPVFITMTLAAATIDSIVAASIMHVCGLFAIVWYVVVKLLCNSYRLERIGRIQEPGSVVDSHLMSDVEVYDCIKKVCNMHRNSLKSVERIQHSFSISFLSLMVSGSIGVSMLIFDILLTWKFPLKTLVLLVILIGVKVSMFYMNWIIQNVIDSSEEVFMSAYDRNYSDWYNLSVKAQQLIFIILQRSIKPCRVVAGNLCEINVQTFATILKASLSYVTVMISVQSEGQMRRRM